MKDFSYIASYYSARPTYLAHSQNIMRNMKNYPVTVMFSTKDVIIITHL